MQEMFEKLALGPGCRLLLVLAPAGSERIESLRRWAAGDGAPVAWVTLDAADNDPARFLARVRAALENAAGQPLDGAGSDVIELLNALAGLEAPQLALVLENYQVIEASAVHTMVQLMLDYPPPGLVLMLVSESAPPLELARMRVRRQMVEVR
jgi:LuxR family transcriptional regulator, maltose regulon positive regulatory protein